MNLPKIIPIPPSFRLHGLGMLLLIPFTYFNGTDPFTNFANEWLAFLIGILLIGVYLFSCWPLTVKIPAVAALPAGMALLIILQTVVNPDVVFSGAHLAILYMIWTAFIMLIAADVAEQCGRQKFVGVLSAYLVAGGVWNVLAEFRRADFHDGLITFNANLLGVGSLGQGNQLCDYMFLAACSALYLFARKRLNWPVLIAVLILFSGEMTVSISRSALLYMLAGAVLVWLWRKSTASETDQRLFKAYLLFIVLFAGWQLFHSWSGSGHSGTMRMVNLAQDENRPSPRLLFWLEAWQIFLQAPWLGTGFGEFDWQVFLHSGLHSHAAINNRVEHAHNLFLQLLAEMGVAGLACFLVFGGLWLKQLSQNCAALPSIGGWWLTALLMTLGIHSMLEYPLWYSHFLGIFAVLTGGFDSRLYALKLSRLTQGALGLIPVVALYLLIDTGRSFLQLEKYYEAARLGKPLPGNGQELVAIGNAGLLKYYSIKYFAAIFILDSEHASERYEFVQKAMHFEPIPPLIFKEVAYLAFLGKQQEALALFHLAESSYPNELPKFAAQVQNLPEADRNKLTFLFEDKTVELAKGQ
ncbi:MAG: Wzy polymerase domain-containing protein [Methylomonas sp.]